ncbi:MAG: hypothetical protein G3H99_02410 [Ferrovum sp.]|nr:hypothetical protein [Ferrovum sp.]NDU87296.1 hypothetical protein [Ferrovum sp.]
MKSKKIFAKPAVICGLALLASSAAYADPYGPPPVYPEGQGFSARKDNILARLQERQSAIQQAIQCVSNAQQPQALKVCMQQLRSQMPGPGQNPNPQNQVPNEQNNGQLNRH